MHGQRLLGYAWVRLVAVLLLGLAAARPGETQVSVPPPTPERVGNSGASLERVIGEVTATNPAVKQMELKMDGRGTVMLSRQDRVSARAAGSDGPYVDSGRPLRPIVFAAFATATRDSWRARPTPRSSRSTERPARPPLKISVSGPNREDKKPAKSP